METVIENKDKILKEFKENPEKLKEVKEKVDKMLEDTSFKEKAIALRKEICYEDD